MSVIYRKKYGKGFTYVRENGKTVTDKSLKRYIAEMVIPPAWQDVEITTDRSEKVLASGRDDAGRKQYIYNQSFTAKKEKEKYERIVRFGQELETMRRVTGQHLRGRKPTRERTLACMVRLIDAAYFRPGSDTYSSENDSYGLTTMRSRHLTIDGDKLVFSYVGKSSQDQMKEVEDKRLAKIVAELDELPGYEIFKYIDEDGNNIDVKSHDLNAYIREVMGEDFSAKDFRTWAGTVIAAVALDELGISDEDKTTKSNILAAVKKVAQHLGNTPSVARTSYIDPRVIKAYTDGQTLSYFRDKLKDVDLKSLRSPDERAVTELLQAAL